MIPLSGVSQLHFVIVTRELIFEDGSLALSASTFTQHISNQEEAMRLSDWLLISDQDWFHTLLLFKEKCVESVRYFVSLRLHQNLIQIGFKR
jgi:hypothetical protein